MLSVRSNEMDLFRAFIAISIPSSVQNIVENIQDRFKEIRAPIRWVKPSNLHLTLKFLGNVTQEQIEGAKNCLKEVGQGVSFFTLKTSEIGGFPNLNYPKVLWLGFSNPDGQLHKLVEKIEFQLQKIGFKQESRKFTPHLTIGRVKSLKGKKDFIRILHEEKNVSCNDICVTCFKLIKSDLKPSGPEYSVLHTFNFSKE